MGWIRFSLVTVMSALISTSLISTSLEAQSPPQLDLSRNPPVILTSRIAPQPSATIRWGPRQYTRVATFRLPVQFDELVRQKNSKCQLHVKRDGGAWETHETIDLGTAESLPSPSFLFTAPANGEYLFAATMIDRQGQSKEPDAAVGTARLHVIVDTNPPLLDGRVDASVSLLDVIAADPNLDPKSIEATVLDDVLKPLVRRKDGHTFLLTATDRENDIRIRAADLAGNVSVKVIPAQATRPTEVPITYTNSTKFIVPIAWPVGEGPDGEHQAQIHVQRDERDWQLDRTLRTGASSFRFNADGEGEYRFSAVLRDSQGRSIPKHPVAGVRLHVVVDRTAPELTARIVPEGGGAVLRVTAVDANLDVTSLQAWVVSEAVKRPLVSRPGERTQFPLADADLTRTIRISAADRAGNLTAIEAPAAELGPQPPVLRTSGQGDR